MAWFVGRQMGQSERSNSRVRCNTYQDFDKNRDLCVLTTAAPGDGSPSRHAYHALAGLAKCNELGPGIQGTLPRQIHPSKIEDSPPP